MLKTRTFVKSNFVECDGIMCGAGGLGFDLQAVTVGKVEPNTPSRLQR